MAKPSLPSVEFVRECLEYRDGKLYWLRRPEKHFECPHDYNTWNTRFSGKEAGCTNLQNKGLHIVRIIRIQGWNYRRSVLTWVVVKGEWPPRDIDHEDRNTINDHIDNLRLASESQNNANATLRKDSTTGLKGVSLHRGTGKYKAAIQVNKKNIYLGLFPTPELAYEAYLKAAQEHFGEFACGG